MLREQYEDVILHGTTTDVPNEVLRDIALFEYRERFMMSTSVAKAEPNLEVEKAFTIWQLRRVRDKLREGKQP